MSFISSASLRSKINGGREAAKNRQQQKQIAEKQLPIFIISRSIYYWAAAVY